MGNRDVNAPDPAEVVAALSDLDPSLERICLNGSCYKLYKLLKSVFPDAESYMNATRDHVVTRIGGELYDISGKLPKKRHADYHAMSSKEREVASRWAHRKGFS